MACCFPWLTHYSPLFKCIIHTLYKFISTFQGCLLEREREVSEGSKNLGNSNAIHNNSNGGGGSGN